MDKTLNRFGAVVLPTCSGECESDADFGYISKAGRSLLLWDWYEGIGNVVNDSLVWVSCYDKYRYKDGKDGNAMSAARRIVSKCRNRRFNGKHHR